MPDISNPTMEYDNEIERLEAEIERLKIAAEHHREQESADVDRIADLSTEIERLQVIEFDEIASRAKSQAIVTLHAEIKKLRAALEEIKRVVIDDPPDAYAVAKYALEQKTSKFADMTAEERDAMYRRMHENQEKFFGEQSARD